MIASGVRWIRSHRIARQSSLVFLQRNSFFEVLKNTLFRPVQGRIGDPEKRSLFGEQ